MGRELGTSEGRAVGALVVGALEGCSVGKIVGIAVGEYVTRLTPTGPETTAVPEHLAALVQPSRIRYVCVVASAGTVYCTCAQTLSQMQAAGGWSPVPVSSYTTSTPAAE